MSIDYKFSVDDLPRFSPWPARLLELQDFPQKIKNAAELNREYDREKWGPLFEKVRISSKVGSIHDVDLMYLGSVEEILCFASGQYYLTTNLAGHRDYVSLINKTANHYASDVDSFVDLGCGYGSILFSLAENAHFKNRRFAGLEYTQSGFMLTRFLSEQFGLEMITGKCDITQEQITKNAIPRNALIYTSYVTHCIPLLPDHFVDAILELKPKRVIHFEPCYEHCQNGSLTDLMRKRYIEKNDYNTNLMTLLRKASNLSKIRIINETPSIFGTNPLFCVSIIVWEPATK